jgi:hypothetical protein
MSSLVRMFELRDAAIDNLERLLAEDEAAS